MAKPVALVPGWSVAKPVALVPGWSDPELKPLWRTVPADPKADAE